MHQEEDGTEEPRVQTHQWTNSSTSPTMLFNDTFIHHCEILPQGLVSCHNNFMSCKANPGHEGFIPVSIFTSKFLDPLHKKFTSIQKDYIRLMIDSTVRITLDYTSMTRPDTFPRCTLRYPCVKYRGRKGLSRSGTGYLPFHEIIEVQGGSCPCPYCRTSNRPRTPFWTVCVSTATHVVFDGEEAKNAVVELFYDSDSGKGVRYLYGSDVYGDWNQRYSTDLCVLKCVTHEAGLVDTFTRMMEQKKKFTGELAPPGIMVSHPHGMSKMVSLGFVDQKCFIPDSDSMLDTLLGHMGNVDIFHTPICDSLMIYKTMRTLEPEPKTLRIGKPSAVYGYSRISTLYWTIGRSMDIQQLSRRRAIIPAVVCRDNIETWIDLLRSVPSASYSNEWSDLQDKMINSHYLEPLCRHFSIRRGFTMPRTRDFVHIECVSQIILKTLVDFVSLHGLSCFFHYERSVFHTETVLPLPEGAAALLPREPLVQLKRHFFGDNGFWGTISPATVFSPTIRKEETCELVFYVPIEAEDDITFTCFSSLSYTMPACPGCSGARVSAQFCPTDCDVDGLFVHNHHFGNDGEQSLSGRVLEGDVTLRDIKKKRIKIWI